MTEVFLSKTKLSVLSVPRDSYWLFLSAVTELLYAEAGFLIDSCSDLEDEDDKQSTLSDTDSSWASVEVAKLKSSYAESTTSDSDNHYDRTPQQSTPKTFPSNESENIENDDYNDEQGSGFFHIAFTPLECTIICSESIMTQYFSLPLNVCQQLGLDTVKLVGTSFIKLQLDSEGAYDNCSKILELTEPLSRKNIPLYFLSTHFSNIVLVPFNLKDKVVKTLERKNFELSNSSDCYVFNLSPANTPVREYLEMDVLDIEEDLPGTMDLSEKAFRAFKNANIRPVMDSHTLLLLTGARTGHVTEIIEKTARMTLRPKSIPQYFAITRTSPEEVSLLLPKASRIRASLGFRSKNLMGSVQDVIVPISLDLYKLPLDTSGIVAGVAGSLFHGVETHAKVANCPFEMYYLSMARSAIIMVPRENLKAVGKILNEIEYNTL